MEPWGNPWIQSAHIAEQISLMSSVFAATRGINRKHTSWKKFMPSDYQPPKAPKQKLMSGMEALGIMRKRFK
jgi:hypothetical protein